MASYPSLSFTHQNTKCQMVLGDPPITFYLFHLSFLHSKVLEYSTTQDELCVCVCVCMKQSKTVNNIYYENHMQAMKCRKRKQK